MEGGKEGGLGEGGERGRLGWRKEGGREGGSEGGCIFTHPPLFNIISYCVASHPSGVMYMYMYIRRIHVHIICI